MTTNRISRRKLLAGAIGVGGGTIAGLAFVTSPSRDFTDTTEIETGGTGRLLLDWRQTYNGARLTETIGGSVSASPSGGAISLGNVLPGDTGSFSVRVRLDGESDDLAVTPKLTFALTDEGGSPGLEGFVRAAVWYDDALLGIEALGARNAERDPGEGLVHPDAEGTLADVASALGSGVALDAAPTVPGRRCLEPGDSVTITFGWRFPPEQKNINAVQGDVVEFDLRFDAVEC